MYGLCGQMNVVCVQKVGAELTGVGSKRASACQHWGRREERDWREHVSAPGYDQTSQDGFAPFVPLFVLELVYA